MELAVVAFALVAVLAAFIIVGVVVRRWLSMREEPIPWVRMLGNRGLPWLVLGLVSLAVYPLFDVSIALPMLVVAGATVYMIRDARRRPPSSSAGPDEPDRG